MSWMRYSGPKMAQSSRVVSVPQSSRPVLTSRMYCFVLFSLTLASRGKLYITPISSHTITLAAIITEEMFARHWFPVFQSRLSASDVVTALSNSPALVETSPKAVSNIARPENILPGKLSFKPEPSTFSVPSQPFHSTVLRQKASRAPGRKTKHFGDHHTQHLQPMLTEMCFSFKPQAHSTRSRSLFSIHTQQKSNSSEVSSTSVRDEKNKVFLPQCRFRRKPSFHWLRLSLKRHLSQRSGTSTGYT